MDAFGQQEWFNFNNSLYSTGILHFPYIYHYVINEIDIEDEEVIGKNLALLNEKGVDLEKIKVFFENFSDIFLKEYKSSKDVFKKVLTEKLTPKQLS